ncbi:Spore germination protein GerPC [compost metagenome]
MAWQQWLHSLAHRNEQLEKHQAELESRYLKLEEQLRRLEEANQKLKEQVDGLKPAQYGNITYKVQELHVNELTGTLNIGLTSLADEGQMKAMMEQMKLDGQDLQIPGGSPAADSSG